MSMRKFTYSETLGMRNSNLELDNYFAIANSGKYLEDKDTYYMYVSKTDVGEIISVLQKNGYEIKVLKVVENAPVYYEHREKGILKEAFALKMIHSDKL